MKTRTIEVEQLARVEGESSLRITIDGDNVRQVELAIFEPPRYFEALLNGRSYREAPDITARICGICPVAYQMSAVNALEAASTATLPRSTQNLRRLLYCGEWIESHALHIHMLHAPDFFNQADAVELARLEPEAVGRALTMKKAGNGLMALIGGREVHPINVKVGGFYRKPDQDALLNMLPNLRTGRDAAIETARWVAGLPFPDYETDATLVALQHATEYPMIHGRIAATSGLNIAMEEFDQHMREHQVPHSNALHATLDSGQHYLTGPLARFTLNYERLSERCQQLAADAGIAGGTRNPYKSIIVRSLEVVHAFEEAIRIIENEDLSGPASVPVDVADADTAWATEAPRGLLFHRYAVDGAGTITKARIVAPTSQNQGVIEQDLVTMIGKHLGEDDDTLARYCENVVRNHDPCISCATHFLKVDVRRSHD